MKVTHFCFFAAVLEKADIWPCHFEKNVDRVPRMFQYSIFPISGPKNAE